MRTFQTEAEFDAYMKEHKPQEVWLKEFSEEYPYLVFESFNGRTFRGKYNKQGVMFSGNQNDFKWLFSEGLYVID